MVTIFPAATAPNPIDMVVFDEIVSIQRSILLEIKSGNYDVSIYNTAMTGLMYFPSSVSKKKQKTIFKVKDIDDDCSCPTPIIPTATDYWNVWMTYTQDLKLQTQMDNVVKYFTDLGYNIVQKLNTTTNNTFYWYIQW